MVTHLPPSVLDLLLDPVADCLTQDVAARIADPRLDVNLQERLDILASKANEGTLTPQEHVEYEEYVEAMDLVGILKAKARTVLKRLDHS